MTGLTTMGLAESNATRALTDRKGATSLEYAMIAAGIAATVMVGFQAFYTSGPWR